MVAPDAARIITHLFVVSSRQRSVIGRDVITNAAGFVLNLLYGICCSIGMILAGLGGFAAFLALLDGSYAQAAASALVALLLCPFAAPMLLSLAGSALIVTAAALFAWLF